MHAGRLYAGVSLSAVLKALKAASGGGWCINCITDLEAVSFTKHQEKGAKLIKISGYATDGCRCITEAWYLTYFLLQISWISKMQTTVCGSFVVKSLLYPHCTDFQRAFIVSLLLFVVLTHQIICQKSPEAISLWHCSIANIMAACHSQTASFFRNGLQESRRYVTPRAHFRRGTPSHPLPIFGQELSGVSTRRGILLPT